MRYTLVGAGIKIDTADGPPLIVITQVQSDAAVLGGYALATAGETIGIAQAPQYENRKIGSYNPDAQGGAHTLMITSDDLLANDTWHGLSRAVAGFYYTVMAQDGRISNVLVTLNVTSVNDVQVVSASACQQPVHGIEFSRWPTMRDEIDSCQHPLRKGKVVHRATYKLHWVRRQEIAVMLLQFPERESSL